MPPARSGTDWLPDEIWLLVMMMLHDTKTCAEAALVLDRTRASVEKKLYRIRRDLAKEKRRGV